MAQCLLSSLAATLLCLAIATSGAQPAPKPDAALIAKHVERLGDADFNTREAATRALVEAGEPALPAVRIALRTSPRLEVQTRAAQIEARIIAGCRKSRSSEMEFAAIPAGTFEMGSSEREAGHRADEKQHTVKLTAIFLMGMREVTQEEYKAIAGTNPSGFSASGEGKAKLPKEGAVCYPVERVSWFDAVEFCNRLSENDGYKPHYKIADPKTAEGSIRSAEVSVLGGRGYRLPTEAEWEYACRAESTGRFSFGDFARNNAGNFKIMTTGGYGEAGETYNLGRTAAVGTHTKNKWGLSDMHGNVGEWCGDWYDKDYYAVSPGEDPPGPAKGTHRVIRGGSWMVTDQNCRSATRFSLTPDERKDYVGFRVARTP